MTVLPMIYKKYGYTFKQVERGENTAIYEQTDEGQRIAYEVFEIINEPAGEVFGKWLEAREKVPSTEQWGSKAFTVHTIEQAQDKQSLLLARIIERRLAKI